MSFEAVVVGGGINGLCTAKSLREAGLKKIALIEANHVGNIEGSSHGSSRITRSAYSDDLFVRMMQYTHQNEWPKLEQDLKMQLLHPCKGLFFGEKSGHINKYAEAVQKSGADVFPITHKQALEIFPQFRLGKKDLILSDQTAGLLAASNICVGLKSWLIEQNVAFIENSRVHQYEVGGTCLSLHTKDAIIKTQGAIFCIGPWTSKLFPFLKSKLTTTHQHVFYWHLSKPELGTLSNFPVWVEIGATHLDNWYGLPSFGIPGIKAARHNLSTDDDPDTLPSLTDETLKESQNKLQQRLYPQIKGLSKWEPCKYTVTHNEDFIWTHHPEDRRIVIGAGFSGHGFKISPLTGAALSAMLLNEDAPFPEYEEAKSRFHDGGCSYEVT